MIVTRFIFILSILATHSFASFSILDYNVRDIEPAEDVELQALQRIVGFFDPDIVIFQEAKRQSDITNFLNANPAYEEIVLEHGSGSRWAILGKLVGVVRFVDGMMPEAFA